MWVNVYLSFEEIKNTWIQEYIGYEVKIHIEGAVLG